RKPVLDAQGRELLPADAAQGPALARILLATGGQTLSEHALHAGRLIIGRTNANDLQIDSRFISRHHCQIVTTVQGCTIEDLNSTNGIFINSKRIRYYNLNDGDVVTIGEHELIYVDERSNSRTGTEVAASPAGPAASGPAANGPAANGEGAG
ncbi:MAG TPA: FHA domain-containing protein, partial [Steroidobacteraceae bacterium]|nr:FHA domain-containing protein [Steroidobacteraceae bacterium]